MEGTFQNGQPHGECIVHYADGSKFKGIFKNGKRKRFEGSYSDDLGDGKFIEKDRNGKVIVEGVYVRGHRQVK